MNASVVETGRTLDPFGFFSGYMSCIRPLGGPERGPDPTYAFHTPYLEYRPGPVVFTLRFDGLEASFGELVIHVNSFVPGSGANALLVTLARASVAELATGAAEIMIKIVALPNVSFALFGYFPEGTDARAAGLTILAEEYGHVESAEIAGDALTPSRFGSGDLMQPDFFIGDQPPVFHRPVSQAMTAEQFEEAAYLRRLEQLPGGDTGFEAAWPRAFIVEALDCYGVLRPGAHGLALGDGQDDLIDLAIAAGCPVTAAIDATQAVDPRAGLAVRTVTFDDLPPDLRGFDYCWSNAPAGPCRSAREARAFIEGSLRCLRPRGLAVHIFDLVAEAGSDDAPAVGLTREQIETLALTLVSRGHDIAQLNFGGSAGLSGAALRDGRTAFGLIIRRSRI